MKKTESERAIRALCGKWRGDVGLSGKDLEHPSFSDFLDWIAVNGYSHYLNFRSARGAREDAEIWFDEEFKQTWRR